MKILPTALASSVAASVVQPLVLFGWAVLPELVAGGDPDWSTWLVFSVFAALYAAPFAVLLGIPLSLALSRLGMFRWWPLAAVGTAAGALFAVLLLRGAIADIHVEVADGATFLGIPRPVLAFAAHGLVGASVFYWVWLRSLRRDPSNLSPPVDR